MKTPSIYTIIGIANSISLIFFGIVMTSRIIGVFPLVGFNGIAQLLALALSEFTTAILVILLVMDWKKMIVLKPVIIAAGIVVFGFGLLTTR